jgi:hypothetical protein
MSAILLTSLECGGAELTCSLGKYKCVLDAMPDADLSRHGVQDRAVRGWGRLGIELKQLRQPTVRHRQQPEFT